MRWLWHSECDERITALLHENDRLREELDACDRAIAALRLSLFKERARRDGYVAEMLADQGMYQPYQADRTILLPLVDSSQPDQRARQWDAFFAADGEPPGGAT